MVHNGGYPNFKGLLFDKKTNCLAQILQSLSYKVCSIILLRLQLHGTIYRPDSFVLVLRYCANLKAIRYESTSLKRIVADKSRV